MIVDNDVLRYLFYEHHGIMTSHEIYGSTEWSWKPYTEEIIVKILNRDERYNTL
jgi:hypothetical protein